MKYIVDKPSGACNMLSTVLSTGDAKEGKRLFILLKKSWSKEGDNMQNNCIQDKQEIIHRGN